MRQPISVACFVSNTFLCIYFFFSFYSLPIFYFLMFFLSFCLTHECFFFSVTQNHRIELGKPSHNSIIDEILNTSIIHSKLARKEEKMYRYRLWSGKILYSSRLYYGCTFFLYALTSNKYSQRSEFRKILNELLLFTDKNFLKK